MELAPGQQLGPYEVIGPLGSGGMGTVYRARDTRLGRDVAIKVSSGPFSARFEREARVIAQLNHPSICTLHDIGPDYLVMELVEGETLADRVSAGPMPAHEVVQIAQQIAEALDVAHDRGVVHRDLKPGNVMIRPDGRVKVLDFGLAKMGGAPAVSSDESPTVVVDDTRAGVILGTAAYMSPEQAMGKSVDKRADVYAFGAVVYEMATGDRLHRGVTTTEVLASVLKEEPRWDRVPPQFRKLLRRCLAKDLQQRLKHVGDVMALVEEGAVDSGPMPAVSTATSRRGWLWPAAAVLLLAAAGAGWWTLGRGAQKVEVLRFQILEEGKYKLQNASPAVSPDGKWVAFQAPGTDGLSHIWLRALDSLESRPIPGTESPNLLQSPPFWSHDSKSIVFAINPGTFAPGQLKRVDLAGGTPQVICDIQAGVSGVAWSPDGVILFTDAGKGYLQQVPATGGQPVPVTARQGDDRFHMWPQFLPGGRTFLYQRVARDKNGIYIGSLDKRPEEQSTVPILRTDRQAFYSPAGGDHLVFLADQTLFAQAFDVATTTLTGQRMAIADGVSSFAPALSGRFSVSANGVLVYNAGPVTAWQAGLIDRASGKTLRLFEWQETVGPPQFSPDSKRVVSARIHAAGGTTDVWVTDLASGNSTKITFGAGRNANPVWSPDGLTIAFSSNRQGVADLYVKSADGFGEERLVLKSDQNKIPSSWSLNGFLMYTAGAAGSNDLWVLPQPERGNSQPVPYLRTQADESRGAFSPDGKWVAYVSRESGQQEVFIRPFDPQRGEESATGGRWLLSRGGGYLPAWSKGGRELVYVSGGRVMAQAVDPDKPFETKGPPEDLAEAIGGGFGISPDGAALLNLIVPKGDAPGQLVVVKNWHAALQK